MPTKRLLWVSAALVLVALTGCTTSEAQPSPTEEMVQSTEPAELETEVPEDTAQGTPCQSPTLGIELLTPGPEWTCEATNDLWLKLTSPLFEVNISNLGRGPFCNPSMDDSCQITPFYANDIVDLQLYTAGGQAREIFGLAEFSDPQASVWVAITWQDMANHALTEDEIGQIESLISSLHLLNPQK